jgi:hypothetical protein
MLVEDVFDGEERGLGVEGVEDGLDQKHVHAPGDERAGLLVVGGNHLLPRHGAVVGPVDVGGEREGAVERADGAGHITAAAGRSGLGLVGGPARAGHGGEVQVLHGRLQLVISLRDHRGAESVGLDEVRPGGKILRVDPLDEVRPGETEQVVVAPQVMRMVAEAFAPEIGLGERMLLDHGAHRAVEDGDAPRKSARRSASAESWRGVRAFMAPTKAPKTAGDKLCVGGRRISLPFANPTWVSPAQGDGGPGGRPAHIYPNDSAPDGQQDCGQASGQSASQFLGARPRARPAPRWAGVRGTASAPGKLVRWAGLEPATDGLENRCSFRLSYHRKLLFTNWHHFTCTHCKI